MNNVPKPFRSEAAALPKGWIREEIPRTSGGISGSRKSDVYYISPSGKRLRSKPELLKFLGEHYDLSAFDYHSGRMLSASNGKAANNAARSKANGKSANQYDFTKAARTDTTLVPPIRQTASIFKQPVTVHKASQDTSKVKVDKQSTAERPRQLYWEKRLAGLRPSYPDEDFQAFELPSNFKPVGPGIMDDIALASITTSLHMNTGSIQGQKTAKAKPNVDPAVYMNPDQPLIAHMVVTQEDIDKQEAKVTATRLRLAKAIEALSG